MKNKDLEKRIKEQRKKNLVFITRCDAGYDQHVLIDAIDECDILIDNLKTELELLESNNEK